MRGPHYGWMCFKSVKTLGALHSASAFSTAKNAELIGLYSIFRRVSARWLDSFHSLDLDPS